MQIVVADDHPLFRSALRGVVEPMFADASITEVGDFPQIEELLKGGAEVDLLLLDLHMPGMNGFSGLIFLRSQYPEVPVIVVSGSEDAGVMRRSVNYGASAFLPKSTPVETMGEVINLVLEGDTWLPPIAESVGDDYQDETAEVAEKLASLTSQQYKVLSLLTAGKLNKQIAYELGVSEATVKAHFTAIFRKFGVHSRTQIALMVAQLNIEDPVPTPKAPAN